MVTNLSQTWILFELILEGKVYSHPSPTEGPVSSRQWPTSAPPRPGCHDHLSHNRARPQSRCLPSPLATTCRQAPGPSWAGSRPTSAACEHEALPSCLLVLEAPPRCSLPKAPPGPTRGSSVPGLGGSFPAGGPILGSGVNTGAPAAELGAVGGHLFPAPWPLPSGSPQVREALGLAHHAPAVPQGSWH